MVRHVDAQKKISRQNKNRQFFQERTSANALFCILFSTSWLHQLKLMTETAIELLIVD